MVRATANIAGLAKPDLLHSLLPCKGNGELLLTPYIKKQRYVE